MPTIYSLLRELVVSTFDLREPAKLVLEDFWDSVFPQKGKDIFVDAFYEAIQDETGNQITGWTKQEIKKILNVEIDIIDYKNIDNNSLASEIQKQLIEKNVALIPSRINTQYDFEQIISSVVFRSMKIFELKLREKENSKLRDELIEKYVRETGKSQAQITNELSLVTDRVNSFERDMDSLNNKMNEAQLLLQRIDKLLNSAKFLNEPRSLHKVSSEDLASNRVQLTNYRDIVRLMAEHWSEFVSPTQIPLQERKDLLAIKRRIAEISQEIGLADDE